MLLCAAMHGCAFRHEPAAGCNRRQIPLFDYAASVMSHSRDIICIRHAVQRECQMHVGFRPTGSAAVATAVQQHLPAWPAPHCCRLVSL